MAAKAFIIRGASRGMPVRKGNIYMNTHVSAETVTQTGPLAFTPGSSVDAADVKRFCVAVNKDAKAVAQGIVDALKQQRVQAQAKESPPGNWLVLVGTVRGEADADLMADPNITANITITANTGDIPATITALNGFFSNWRAVAGLVATGAAVVAGSWLLTIRRRP
jgi:hypothetical protein